MENDLQGYLAQKNEERKKMWKAFFAKHENILNSKVLDISNLLKDDDTFGDSDTEIYRELVENSNIRKLLLNLEVSRYQILKSEYEKHLHAFYKESEMLSKFVPNKWLKAYFESCIILNSEVKTKIDEINTNIISLFIDLTKVNSKQMFNIRYKLYKSEFIRLLQFVSTEDLVLYIRDGLRRYFYEASTQSD